MKEFAWGICKDDMGHTENSYAGTSETFKTTEFLSSFLSWGGVGGRDVGRELWGEGGVARYKKGNQ